MQIIRNLEIFDRIEKLMAEEISSRYLLDFIPDHSVNYVKAINPYANFILAMNDFIDTLFDVIVAAGAFEEIGRSLKIDRKPFNEFCKAFGADPNSKEGEIIRVKFILKIIFMQQVSRLKSQDKCSSRISALDRSKNYSQIVYRSFKFREEDIRNAKNNVQARRVPAF